MNVEAAWIRCSCCGHDIPDTAETNVSFGEEPYPHDLGMGMCVSCGGDKTASGTDEETVRKRLGWAATTFFDARIAVLEKKLSPENVASFKAMTYAKKVTVITRLVEKGAMI